MTRGGTLVVLVLVVAIGSSSRTTRTRIPSRETKEERPLGGLSPPTLMNHDVAAGHRRDRICGVAAIDSAAHLVVVDDDAVRFLPDFDAEFVDAPTAVDLSIDGTPHEAIAKAAVVGAVHRSGTFVFGARSVNYQPV